MGKRILVAGVLAALAAPGAAAAAGGAGAAGQAPLAPLPASALEVRDVPLPGGRALAAARPAHRFTLAALHWRGSGAVLFRTHGADGWSAWHPAAPEDEDRPDPTSAEARGAAAREGAGWRVGNPWWSGVADRLEVRTEGRVAAVRAYTVWSPPLATAAPATAPGTAAAASGHGGGTRTPAASFARGGGRVQPPPIVLRAGWGANEQISKKPLLAPALRFAIVHHTAGVNAYTREQSAAIVRGIQLYHVVGNGWNDIGYNFLVDRFGQAFEGRLGGVDKPVIGAHAAGFNAGSVGVAVIGTYADAGIPKAAQDALVRLLAWRLDLAHVDPLSTLSWLSGGNSRYPKGIPVFLRAISGHRDTGFTDCPGDALEAQLPGLARRVAAVGLPKLYDPVATGKLGALVHFTARLSKAGPWRVTVVDADGVTVAQGGGSGAAVDWTWDATGASQGVQYGWTIAAGVALPAAGTIGRRPPPPPPPPLPPPGSTSPPGGAGASSPSGPAPASFLTGFALSSTVLSPNGDGADDTALVSYTLAQKASVTAFVLDQSGTAIAQQLFADQKQSARTISFTWDPAALPDGHYRFVVAARLPTGDQTSAGADVLVDRTLSQLAASPATISPNGDGVQDGTAFAFTLAKPALVALRVLAADGSVVATPFSGQLAAGPQQVPWDGKGTAGAQLADGVYTAQATVTDDLGNVVEQLPITVDTVAPVLTIVDGPGLKLNVSKQASIAVTVNGAAQTVTGGPGDVQLPAQATPPTSVTAVATDAAGNKSATVSWP